MRDTTLILCSLALVGCTTHGDPNPEPAGAAPVEPVHVEAAPAESPPSTPLETPAPELRWTEARCDLPPVSLTASDGSGLSLTRFDARAVVNGPLAFTEIELSFHNPEDRQIEGRFSVTLPEDAAISRLAMQIDGRWQEGEIVEKQAARVAYEDFLHRRQDPALMEREAGNVYSARVFPIPARGDKHLIVSYSQELAGPHEPYRLPLCGLPNIAALDVEVRVAQPIVAGASEEPSRWSERVFAVHERDQAPHGDLEVHNLGTSTAYGVRSGELVIASVVPKLDAVARPIARATILFDTSASRANDFAGQVQRLGELVRALGAAQRGLEVEVIAFDQTAEPVFAGPAVEFGEAAEAKLRDRGPLGASAFDVALAAVRGPVAPDRLILVSDGMLTAGDEFGRLHDRLRELEDDGLRRLDVIVDGNAADQTALELLARGDLPEHGVVLRGSVPLPEMVERIGAATRSHIRVEVEGATWVWPETLDGMQPGDAALIYAVLGGSSADRELHVKLGGETTSVPLLAAAEPLLERAHARATIAAHEAALLGELTAEQAASIRAEIIEQSVRARVLSDLTALLVLESEDDYRRFGIQRNALADILFVGEQGIDVMRRSGDQLVFTRAVGRSWGEPGDDEADEEHEEDNERRSSARISLADAGDPLGGFGYGHGSMGGVSGGVVGGAPSGVAGGVAEDYAPASEAKKDVSLDGLLDPSRVPAPKPQPAPIEEARPSPEPTSAAPQVVREPPPRANAHTGRYATIMRLLAGDQYDQALAEARAWVAASPGDVLALVALGDAHAAAGDATAAARAYGSLIDLHPSRADIRRMAGARLEALDDVGLALAEDSYRRAVEQRPDHPSGYRLLAWVLVKRGELPEAFEVLERGLEREYPEDRYLGVDTVLRQDLGIVAAIWIARDPAREAEIRERTIARYTRVNNRHSLRFVLNWESDANDVDLHIWDSEGGHAFFSETSLASGGELIADVTTGFGPEAFVIDGRRSGFPYKLMAHYYERGAMGYGMGKLAVLEHDGEGNVAFSEHPFVVMKDDAWVDLTIVRRRLLDDDGR